MTPAYIALALLAAGPLGRDDKGPKLQVNAFSPVPWKETVDGTAWGALCIELLNEDTEKPRRLTVVIQRQAAGRQAVLVTLPEEVLPPAGTRRYRLAVPTEVAAPEVIVYEGGKVLLKATCRASAGAVLYAVLTSHVSMTGQFGLPSDDVSLQSPQYQYGLYGPAMAFAACTPEQFPQQPELLRHLTAIVWHRARPAELDADQRAALRTYVAGGGTLILLPGEDASWMHDEFIQSLAPVRAREPSQKVMQLPGLNTPPQVTVWELEGGIPIEPTAGFVVARMFPYGRGCAVALAVDPSRTPLVDRDVRARDALWKVVREEVDAVRSRRGAWLDSRRAESSIISALQQALRRVPPPALLVLMVIVSALAVGPGSYMYAMRRRSPVLYAAAVPVVSLVAVFASLIFVTAWRGVRTRSAALRIIETSAGCPFGSEDLYIGGITGVLGAPTTRVESDAVPRGDAPGTTEFAPGRVRFYPASLGQWMQFSFAATVRRDLGGPIAIWHDGNSWRVHNQSGLALEEGVLVELRDAKPYTVAYKVPALAAGESTTLQMELGPAWRETLAQRNGPAARAWLQQILPAGMRLHRISGQPCEPVAHYIAPVRDETEPALRPGGGLTSNTILHTTVPPP